MENLTHLKDNSSNLIDVSESFELEYWSEKFSVTPEQLKSAIKAICNCAADKVRSYLDNNR
ncbi:DUF3606 domain-containing protein [Pedobacter sp. MC2016-14]|uniref:DUF3606 domain-containing protein n=1 Tax=Pedobacter sp. MC2016-14 TaxID=2897327 RepID=UPI001E5194F7|nr:DUF3606 domain-containing protein [Pedobacter sp. MC2016-14]MCD0488667.1 DUF3606 domain-containing protein [Pedobacter sp. MC2016-14]